MGDTTEEGESGARAKAGAAVELGPTPASSSSGRHGSRWRNAVSGADGDVNAMDIVAYDKFLVQSRKRMKRAGRIPRMLTGREVQRLRIRAKEKAQKIRSEKISMQKLCNEMEKFDEKVPQFPALLTRTNARDLLAVKRPAGATMTLFDD